MPVDVPPLIRIVFRCGDRLAKEADRVASGEIGRRLPAARAARCHRPRAAGRAGSGGESRAPSGARVAVGATNWTRAPFGKHRGEQRPLAADALVADPRDLLGQALKQSVVDLRRLVAGHRAALLDPHLARAD